MEAKPVGRTVSPEVPVPWPRGKIPDGAFPLHAVFERRSFNDAAAREADERRAHVGQQLCEVLAHAMVLPGLSGEERDEIEPDGSRASGREDEAPTRVVAARGESDVILVPLPCDDR